MKNVKRRASVVGLSAVLAFSGLPSLPGLHLPKIPYTGFVKAPVAKPHKPKVDAPTTKPGETSKLTKAGKTAGALTIWGAATGGLVVLADNGGEHMANYLGPRLDDAVDDQLRDGYCLSMPELKGTDGCK